MISVTDLRSGVVFEEDGRLLQVLSYEHIKMGRGSANIKVKIRDIKSGATVNKSFINGAKVNDVRLDKKDLQFLYKDNESAHFMNPVTFEQVEISLEKIEGHEFLKEGGNFSISFFQNEPLSLNLPPKMKLAVAETGPSVKGNSATNVFKDAVLENNVRTKVPLFIKIGDMISVDTRTGQYTEKA
ncbi:MAG: elongation factor P [Patescibacteria group bacterium]